MSEIYGLPQPLAGTETVTIHQMQNGQLAKCTMPLSQLLSIITLNTLVSGLPTTAPTTAGVVWNNGGALSLS